MLSLRAERILKNGKMNLKTIYKSIVNLFFPECCPVCGRALSDYEYHLCTECFEAMPRVAERDGHMVDEELLFIGARSVVSAKSMFQYNRASAYANIIKDIKYHNRPQLGEWLARKFAEEQMTKGWFDDIDMIVPVPLHFSKLVKRGYNQSDYIAKGISQVTSIPVVQAVVASKPHKTQTSQSAEARRLNVCGVFSIGCDVSDKRILLVDDVITTGATMSECCDVLRQAGAGDIKVFSLALAESV